LYRFDAKELRLSGNSTHSSCIELAIHIAFARKLNNIEATTFF
jgi:hypothetical protein